MNEYVEILKRHVAENPPNYGSDADSISNLLIMGHYESPPAPGTACF